MNSLPAPAARVKPSNDPHLPGNARQLPEKPGRRKYVPTTQRSRKVILAAWHADLSAGALRVLEEGKEDVYFLQRLDSDFGACFKLEKVRPAKGDVPFGVEDPYDVCLDGANSTCECKGFLRHGHCRHVEALSALLRAGRLPGAMTCTTTKACA